MILFHNFILFVFTFFPFSDKRGLGDRPFRLLRPQGPRFFGGNLDRAGEQKCRSCLGVGFLWSYQFVPSNLAASLDARKRSDVMTFEKRKEVAVPLLAPE